MLNLKNLLNPQPKSEGFSFTGNVILKVDGDIKGVATGVVSMKPVDNMPQDFNLEIGGNIVSLAEECGIRAGFETKQVKAHVLESGIVLDIKSPKG